MTEKTLPTYMVYQITFDGSKKVYIGYTSKGPDGRLQQHIKNMRRGLDTHLYRAMRKYGIANLNIEIVEICKSREHAQEREKFHIKEKNSFREGYNMTEGGDGGDCISHMDPEKLKKWKKQRKELSTGFNNGNCSGVTDDIIVDHACIIAKKHGYLTRGLYKRYVLENKDKYNLPENIHGRGFRFDGKGFEGLKELVAAKLNIDVSALDYKKTEEHKRKISKTNVKYCWVHKEKEFLRIFKTELELFENKGWKRGRVNKL